MINPWVNDPRAGAVNAANNKRIFNDITDGSSNTIFVGHGSIDPSLYSSKVASAQSSDIFKGGDPATARRVTTNQRDTAHDSALNWGGPFSYGALMGIGDATVRTFPYTYSGGVIDNGVSTTTTPGLGAFLTPPGGEQVTLPPM